MRDVARVQVPGRQREDGPDGGELRRSVPFQAETSFRRREHSPRLAQYRRNAGDAHRGLPGAGRQMGGGDGEFSRVSDVVVHFWTASDGVQLAFHETGRGRPVILLHGLFSDANMNWIKFGHAARIAGEGFRVIMPDLRAHGHSGKPHEPEHYPKGILARDLRELVAHLSLTEFDLGGFSLGARTTVEGVGEGLLPRRAVLGGAGLEGLRHWERRKLFFLEAIAVFDRVPRGDPHWLSVQLM